MVGRPPIAFVEGMPPDKRVEAAKFTSPFSTCMWAGGVGGCGRRRILGREGGSGHLGSSEGKRHRHEWVKGKDYSKGLSG